MKLFYLALKWFFATRKWTKFKKKKKSFFISEFDKHPSQSKKSLEFAWSFKKPKNLQKHFGEFKAIAELKLIVFLCNVKTARVLEISR